MLSVAESTLPGFGTDLFNEGYLEVTDFPGVDPTGNGDSTAGIQEAIDEAFDHKMGVYVPLGTYNISKTLEAYSWQNWRPSANVAQTPHSFSYTMVGETSTPGVRPIFKLVANAAGFQSPGLDRPMIVYQNFKALNSSAVNNAIPSHPLGVPANFKILAGDNYSTILRGIDFDLNAGGSDDGNNDGASGVYMGSAQRAIIADVSVIATGGYSGFSGMPAANSPTINVKVEGGKYGLELVSGVGANVFGARLYNQEISALRNPETGAAVIVGFEIKKDAGIAGNSDPVIVTAGSDFYTSRGAYTLIDGTITVTGGGSNVAIDNSAGRALYLRNVYVTGTDDLVQSGSENTVTGTGAWKRIEEYSFTNQTTSGTYSYNAGTNTYTAPGKINHVNVINGVVSETPEVATSIINNVTAPTTDFVGLHAWGAMPSISDGQSYVKVTDYGATPLISSSQSGSIDNFRTLTLGNTSGDDTAAIQAAIDDASANGGNGRVFLPRGVYHISGTLNLHSNTKLFGVGPRISVIAFMDSWQPTSGEVTMVETVDDANATTVVDSFTLYMRTKGDGPYNFYPAADPVNRVTGLSWRAGRNSIVGGVQTTVQWVKKKENGLHLLTNPHNGMKISGNGGGRMYGATPASGLAPKKNPDYRALLIDGTTEPLSLYGLNVENARTDAEVEIRGAKNIRIYGMKREGRGGVLIRDGFDANGTPNGKFSENIAVYSAGALRGWPNALGYFNIAENSSGVLMANLLVDTPTQTPIGELLYEDLVGEPEVKVGWPAGISLYKRGTIDDSVLYVYNESGGGGNQAPTAFADSYSTGVNVPLTVPANGVLANDTDPESDPLTAIRVANASDGNVVLNSDGSFTYTPGTGFSGSDSFTYKANDGSFDSNTVTVDLTVGTTQNTTVSFTSIADEDGQIRESSPTSDIGGLLSNTGPLRAGDHSTQRQYKSIVSFDTSTIPAGATIQSATLRLRRAGLNGSNPFTSGFGEARVDIKGGSGFRDNLALHVGDFQASADGVNVAQLSNAAAIGDWSIGTLDSASRTLIESNNNIQFRVYFENGDNGDGSTDQILWNSGDASDVSLRPELVIVYSEASTSSADFDGDGDVDGADFLSWQRGFGTPAPNATPADGDANGDQTVNGDDLTVWQGAFGTTGSALQLAATTEPVPENAAAISTVSTDLIDAAAALWQAAGYDTSSLADTNVQVQELNGNLLGMAYTDTNTLVIDRNGADQGWFIDPTPWDDYEFNRDGFATEEDAEGVDLLSVLAHEMGHLLGLGHDDGVMGEALGTGERRLPSSASAVDLALAMALEGDDDDL